jgi:hypothetical protein
MMKRTLLAAIVLCGGCLAFGQAFEGAITGGPMQLSKSGAQITSSLSGVPGAGDTVALDNGWNLGFRATVNPYRIFGFEFGYIYNRTHLLIGGADQGGMDSPGVWRWINLRYQRGLALSSVRGGRPEFQQFRSARQFFTVRRRPKQVRV